MSVTLSINVFLARNAGGATWYGDKYLQLFPTVINQNKMTLKIVTESLMNIDVFIHNLKFHNYFKTRNIAKLEFRKLRARRKNSVEWWLVKVTYMHSWIHVRVREWNCHDYRFTLISIQFHSEQCDACIFLRSGKLDKCLADAHHIPIYACIFCWKIKALFRSWS